MMRLCIFLLLLSFWALPETAFSEKDPENLYVLKKGFIFQPDNVTDAEIYTGGVWKLYFELEQRIPVDPQIRRFLSGQLIVLFKLGFDQEGRLTTIQSVKRYYWYNIDALGQSIVDLFIETLGSLEGWNNEFKGEVLFPVSFKTTGGRIVIDYNAYSMNPMSKIRIGKK